MGAEKKGITANDTELKGRTNMSLDMLENEAIEILRETYAQFSKPILLYSAGKDSSVLLHLAYKAFYPDPIPFPLLHVDTGFKFPEMYEFRDRMAEVYKCTLHVHRNEEAIAQGMNPKDHGTQACCARLKTEALLSGLKYYEADAAIGGARREEEKARAKERIFSFRNIHGRWDSRNQRPELWSIYNGKLKQGENMRVFPLSNWTELDVWEYIRRESIELVPLYYAAERKASLDGVQKTAVCRYRTLGCMPCTGAVESEASTLDEIIQEVEEAKYSERATRVIDHDAEGSMEMKKNEGYF